MADMSLGKAVLEIDVAGDLKKKLAEQQAFLGKTLDVEQKLKTLNTAKLDLAKRQAEWMGSPKGQQAMKAQLEYGKQMAVVMKQMNWAQMVAEQGKVGASLSLLEDKLKGMSGAMTGIFTASTVATASMYGLVAAANPSLFSTLNDSFKMVSIQLGRFLMPVVADLARGLQGLSAWFQSIDADTRQQITTWAGWIAKAALAAVALKGILVVGGLVIGVVKPLVIAWFAAERAIMAFKLSTVLAAVSLGGLKTALSSTWAVMAAHPLTATIIAVGALAAAFGYLKRNAGEAMAGVNNPHGGPAGRPHEGITPQDIAALPTDIRKRVDDAKTPEEKRRVLAEETEKYKKHVERLQAARLLGENPLPGHLTPEVERGFEETQAAAKKTMPARLFHLMPGRDEAEEEAQETHIAGALKRTRGGQDLSDAILKQIAAKVRIGQTISLRDVQIMSAEQGLANLQGVKDKAGDPFKQNLEMPMQSRYMGFAQYSEAQQLAALNVGDAQAEVLRQQMEATLEQQKETVTTVAQVRDRLENIGRMMENMGF